MRALDDNWEYDAVGAGLRGAPPAIVTAPPRGRQDKGGRRNWGALRLHPRGRLILAWVSNRGELAKLTEPVRDQFKDEGCTPVLAFTSSLAVVNEFRAITTQCLGESNDRLTKAHDYVMLYHLSASEEFVFQQIGLPLSALGGYKLNRQPLTTAFANRLSTVERPLREAIHQWRRELDAQGVIAWPLRSGGPLKDSERDDLFQAWRELMLKGPKPQPLSALDETSKAKVEVVRAVLGKMGITADARNAGGCDR
jgi:hypothetical protein